jgi:hypothetical protein
VIRTTGILETFDLLDNYMPGEDYLKLAAKMFVDEKKNVDTLGLKQQ